MFLLTILRDSAISLTHKKNGTFFQFESDYKKKKTSSKKSMAIKAQQVTSVLITLCKDSCEIQHVRVFLWMSSVIPLIGWFWCWPRAQVAPVTTVFIKSPLTIRHIGLYVNTFTAKEIWFIFTDSRRSPARHLYFGDMYGICTYLAQHYNENEFSCFKSYLKFKKVKSGIQMR